MKVERISDTQVKVILYASDLSDRDINFAELAYGTDKTAGLFREMMEHAVTHCGFKFPNSPLMIEATPLSLDSLMLVISVVDENNVGRVSGLNFLKEFGKLKDQARRNLDGAKGKIKKTVTESCLVYALPSIDVAALAAARLNVPPVFHSAFIKKDGSYYLVVETHQDEYKPYIKKFEAILSEYGSKANANALYISHLKEHGDVLIAENAVSKLSRV